MTEANKKRIVKYLMIVADCDNSLAEQYLNVYVKFKTFSNVKTAVQCAIAEVEAVIVELQARNLNYAYHSDELTELKSLLV